MITSKDVRDWVKLGLAAAVERPASACVVRAVRTAASGARIHVLGYHRVVDRVDYDGAVNPRCASRADAFRRQMEQLRDALRRVAARVRRARRRRRASSCRTTPPPSRSTTGIATSFCAPIQSCARSTFQRRCSCRPASPTPRARQDLAARSPLRRRLGRAKVRARPRRPRRHRDGAAASRAPIACSPPPGRPASSRILIDAAPAATLADVIDVLEATFGAAPLDEGAEVLSPAEVRTLADRGWEIGAHTIGHVVLTHEPPSEQRRQLASRRPRSSRGAAGPAAISRTATASIRPRSSPSCAAPATKARSPRAIAPTRRARAIRSASRARSCGRRTRAARRTLFAVAVGGASARQLRRARPDRSRRRRSRATRSSRSSASRSSKPELDPQPTEVELAY